MVGRLILATVALIAIGAGLAGLVGTDPGVDAWLGFLAVAVGLLLYALYEGRRRR